MNEFTRMIREALVGDESGGAHIDEAEIREALSRIDKRNLVVRVMGWLTILSMTAVAGLAGWQFFNAPSEDTRAIVGWAVLFLWALGGITCGKAYIFAMQAHLSLRKDMKRVEIKLAAMGD